MKIKLLVALLFFLNAYPCVAQNSELIKPGSDKINGSFIEAYSNEWEVSIHDSLGNKRLVRIWTDRLEFLELDKTDYLYRTQGLYDAESKWQETWINVVKAENLKPAMFTQLKADGTRNAILFKGHELLINHGYSHISETIELENPVFDWNLYGILLVGLPFEKNASYKIPLWSQEAKAEGLLTASMEGEEEVQTLSGITYDTQKIVTDQGLTFWLVKEKPYVIQLTLELENGSTMIWEMR